MIGLIGGTGLGDALLDEGSNDDVVSVETPFGKPSAPIQLLKWHDVPLAILPRHGVGHTLNPSQVPYRANIYALKSLGVKHIIASGAVGSLREDIAPRDLVIADQVIDKTFRRTPTFFDDGLAVHVEFSQPFCSQMRDLLLRAGESLQDATVHRAGTYVCMEGPAFSTVAESNMHRQWGGDLIGMTCMPEAKLAREAEIGYGLVALATDYDCWRPHEPGITPQALLEEIIGHLKSATANAVALIKQAIALVAEKPLADTPIQRALDLAVWTQGTALSSETRAKYGVLLERYAAAKSRG